MLKPLWEGEDEEVRVVVYGLEKECVITVGEVDTLRITLKESAALADLLIEMLNQLDEQGMLGEEEDD